MKRTIIIHNLPVSRINAALAAHLVGLAVDLRPDLYLWTIEPTDPTQGDYYFVHNDDLRAAITAQLGAATAHGLYDLLPLGRVTTIERCCCTLKYSEATSAEKVAA